MLAPPVRIFNITAVARDEEMARIDGTSAVTVLYANMHTMQSK